MFEDAQGPIERFSWGRFIIRGLEHSESEAGTTGAGKDIRLVGLEVSEWRERKGHKLAPAMISGVYGRGIEVLVIGTGVQGLLTCPDTVKRAVADAGIAQLILARTPVACQSYNALHREGKKVALLAHGTC